MNSYKRFLLIALFSSLSLFARAQDSTAIHLSGTWAGRERDASEAGEIIFNPKNKMAYSFEGNTLEGRYEIDSSKSPNLLVFFPDKYPEKKAYASLEVKSDAEIRMSHLCDGTPAALARQSIITFTRK